MTQPKMSEMFLAMAEGCREALCAPGLHHRDADALTEVQMKIYENLALVFKAHEDGKP